MEVIEKTIARLLTNKAISGVLILQTKTGAILRAAGSLFALSVHDSGEASQPAAFSSIVLDYAEKSWRAVQSLENGFQDLDPDGLKFVRLRFKKKELLITPGPLCGCVIQC